MQPSGEVEAEDGFLADKSSAEGSVASVEGPLADYRTTEEVVVEAHTSEPARPERADRLGRGGSDPEEVAGDPDSQLRHGMADATGEAAGEPAGEPAGNATDGSGATDSASLGRRSVEQPSSDQNDPNADADTDLIGIKPLSNFLAHYSVYDIIPMSAKCIYIDSSLSMYRAFRILGENRTSTAYVWDPQERRFIGVLTANDFMRAFLAMYHLFFSPTPLQSVEGYLERVYPQLLESAGHLTICTMLDHITVRSIKMNSGLLFGDPRISLKTALTTMLHKGIHRLPLLDGDGSIICSITYRTVCKFLVSKFRSSAPVLEKNIMDVAIGEANPATVSPDQPLAEVLQLMCANNLSMLPVLEDGRLVDVFSKYDVSAMGLQVDLVDLNLPISAVIARRPQFVEGLTTEVASSTFGKVIKLLAEKDLHRIIIVDDETRSHIVKVISLRHLLAYFLNILDDSETMQQLTVEQKEADGYSVVTSNV